MDGINGNKIIQDTLLSSNDLTNYFKNNAEISRLLSSSIAIKEYVPTFSNNTNYVKQTAITNGFYTNDPDALRFDNGIIKFDPAIYKAFILITSYNMEATSTTESQTRFYQKLNYYLKDDPNYANPLFWGSQLKRVDLSITQGKQYAVTFVNVLNIGAETTGFDINLCNTGTTSFSPLPTANIILIGIPQYY